jgi:flagellar hook-basal body complex protein FliE
VGNSVPNLPQIDWGNVQLDVRQPSAMVAVEKADLSFQMMIQVRNKIVQAYQTISQMQF